MPPAGRKPGSTRWLKTTLLTLTVLLTVAVGFAAWFLSDAARLKPFVEQLVSEATRRTLIVNGSLELSLGRYTTVRATNVDWLNPVWSNAPVMLHVDSIEATVDLLSILEGPITISKGHARGGDLTFEWYEGFPMNWDMRDPNAPRSGEPLKPIPLALQQVELNDVRLRFIHPALAKEVVLEIISAREAQTPGNGIAVVADTAVNDIPLRLDGEVGPFPELIVAGAVEFDIEATGKDMIIDTDGRINRLSELDFERANLKVTAPEITTLLDALLEEPFTSGKLDISGSLARNGDAIDIELAGIVGEIRANGELETTSLAKLDDLKLAFASAGPNAAAVGQLAGVRGLKASPYRIEIKADRTAKGVEISKLSAQTAGIDISGSGVIRALPALRNIDFALTADLASLSTLGDILGRADLPDLPLQLSAEIAADSASASDKVTGSAVLGTATARFAGSLSETENFSGSTLTADLKTTDVREIGRYYGFSPEQPVPLDANVDVKLESGSVSLNSVTLTSTDTKATVRGAVALEDAVADLTVEASGGDLEAVTRLFVAQTDTIILPGQPFAATVDLVYEKNNLQLTTESATVGASRLGFDGTIDFSTPVPAIDATVEAEGPSLKAATAFLELQQVPDLPYAISARLDLSRDGIVLRGIRASLADDQVSGKIASRWPDAPDDISFDLSATGSNLRTIFPENSLFKPSRSPFDIRAEGEFSNNTVRIGGIDATLGDATLTVSGALGLEKDWTADKIRINFSGPDMADIGDLNNWQLRNVPFSTAATISGFRNSFIVDEFSLSVDNSNLDGFIAVDLEETPSFEAKLYSDYLDLTALIQQAEDEEGLADSMPGNAANTENRKQRSRRSSRKERFLSSEPLGLEKLNTLNAGFELDIRSLEVVNLTATNLKIEGTISNGKLKVPVIQGATRYGQLDGSFAIDGSTQPPSVTARATATNAVFAGLQMRAGDVENLPRHNVVFELRSEGSTQQELGAGLDGFFWLRGGNGELPVGKLNILTSDILTELFETLNPFSIKATTAPIACDALYLEIQDGVVQTSPAAILQTDRLSIIAAGQIDLGTEKIDIGFRTTPLRGIGVSASDLVNPFIKLGGNLSNPILVLNPTSTAIQGTAAFMTMGASLLATSLWNRWIASNDACEKMAERAIKTRRKIAPENVPELAPPQ